uniref:Chitin-binding type-2 domain-containing protein n=1 Tax=Anopheles minimus TaxID=112268 RepID=A0A182W0S5_9DIPT
MFTNRTVLSVGQEQLEFFYKNQQMKFLWFITFLLALVGMIAGDACPKGFKAQNNQCVSQRPVHGDCPKGSTYSAKVNLCVHN